MPLPKNIKVLQDIEATHDVISFFQHENTTAWISIKNNITTTFYDNSIRLETSNRRDIFRWKGIKFFVLSLKHYISHINHKEKRSIFLGAGTGLFTSNNKILDSYFPYYDLDLKTSIYMLNCANLENLSNYQNYLKNNQVIVENYLLSIIIKITKIFLYVFLKKSNKDKIKIFNYHLKTKKINTTDQSLILNYVDFVARYKVYRKFFRLLNINKAYIVSAPTKSAMVASLKSLGIQTIEIQHGVVGSLHRGYNYNIKRNTILPTVDRINVYNKFWKTEIVKAGYFKPSMINIVGRLKYDIINPNIKALNHKYFILTGQGAFTKEIIRFLKKANGLLSEKKVMMYYKTHPREFKKETDFIKNELADLECCEIYNGDYTTEELIKYCSAHISVFSSCHFDAIYFKNKTFILDIMEENIMSYYASSHPSNFIKVKKIETIFENIE